jgi:hypothetical protein
LTVIDAPFADARASDLALSLEEQPKPALLTLALAGDGIEIELCVLGCSHQVLVRRPGAEPGAASELSEVVACLPDSRPALPAQLGRARPGEHYEFRSRVLRLDPGAHARRAEELRAASEADPLGLAGVFPGLPGAVTALRCRTDAGVARWSTWHTYPQHGEIVETRTQVRWRA